MCLRSIGNDIVDLKEDLRPVHTRFDQRVFTSEERDLIEGDRQKLWLYWSAKEAAYKAIKRLYPETFFSPALFIYNHIRNIVRFKECDFYCLSKITDDFVYSVCATNKDILYTGRVFTWVGETGGYPGESEAVRGLAKKGISHLLGKEEDQIEIVKCPQNMPYLTLSGKTNRDILSFSHHGRFTLCTHLPG